MRVWGLGVRVQGLGFRVWGSGFKVLGSGSRGRQTLKTQLSCQMGPRSGVLNEFESGRQLLVPKFGFNRHVWVHFQNRQRKRILLSKVGSSARKLSLSVPESDTFSNQRGAAVRSSAQGGEGID